MTDKRKQDKSQDKHVLAKIPQDETPDVNPEGAVEVEPAATSRKKEDKGTVYSKPEQPVEPARLTLPRRGLVAMRRSGGLRFTSRTVTVYRDGRVKATPDPVLGPTPDRRLDDEELAELYRALEQAALPDLPPTSGRQNPDAYAYEMAAHVEGKDYWVELFDGSIPENVAPLLSLLTGYLRPREDQPPSDDNT